MTATGRPSRFAVGTGLMLVMAAVVVATTACALMIAWLVAPGIFHEHLRQAGIDRDSSEAMHVERAFAAAVGVSWGLAAVIATVSALAVSWYLAGRAQRTVTAVAASTARIADGGYDVRVHGGGMGREFDALAAAVNRLAARLAETEATRRRTLSDLAHEMRTPLATIDSYLEAVEDGVRRPDADTMDILHAATGRLRRLAEDVTAVSQAQEGALSVMPVRTTDRELAESAAAAAGEAYAAKGVTLRVEAHAATAVRADPARIGQVLGNLLANALRHTPDGGAVTLRTRCADPDAVIEVADTGDGIASDHLSHVFDRFYRADTARDRDHGGSGIGLTIARALVEQHGGSLSAASDGPGRGATFTVRLPRV
ncbi:sensor histidine kinase [Gordonia sihwensis]|uniref:sensor histidine kinase n=1 Tax=Gordonia TaxID=2053 RepID=UPI0024166C19|nr:HAMP domain-containing sensor histidine kinase [Gordonia sihwensis]WFN91735.1 HAMP domain-containing sensor histidine kinase [Gordonia sihwensis]